MQLIETIAFSADEAAQFATQIYRPDFSHQPSLSPRVAFPSGSLSFIRARVHNYSVYAIYIPQPNISPSEEKSFPIHFIGVSRCRRSGNSIRHRDNGYTPLALRNVYKHRHRDKESGAIPGLSPYHARGSAIDECRAHRKPYEPTV